MRLCRYFLQQKKKRPQQVTPILVNWHPSIHQWTIHKPPSLPSAPFMPTSCCCLTCCVKYKNPIRTQIGTFYMKRGNWIMPMERIWMDGRWGRGSYKENHSSPHRRRLNWPSARWSPFIIPRFIEQARSCREWLAVVILLLLLRWGHRGGNWPDRKGGTTTTVNIIMIQHGRDSNVLGSQLTYISHGSCSRAPPPASSPPPRALATHPSFASTAAATNPINCVEQAGSRSPQNIILHLLATRGIGSTREPKSLLAVLSARAMIIKNH